MNLLKLCALATVCCALNCGCEDARERVTDHSGSPTHSHNGDSHSHGQDHSSDGHSHDQESESDGIHGVNGGHVFSFEPADYVGEWLVSNDDDVTKIFILDKDGTVNTPIKVENLELRRGDSVFTLDAENLNEDGLSAVYSLDDRDLSIAINLGVEVKMEVGEKKYVGRIAALTPHDH